MLHLVFTQGAVDQLRVRSAAGDRVVLMGLGPCDGVFEGWPAGVSVFSLVESDAGGARKRHEIDHEDLVVMTAAEGPVLSW